MDDKRLDRLSNEIYNWVFHFLDTEPDFTGDEAGRVAFQVESAFRKAVNADPEPNCQCCGTELIGDRVCPHCEYLEDDGQPSELTEWLDYDPDC